MAADSKTSYINNQKTPRVGAGIYRAFTLITTVNEKEKKELDHLSDWGEETLCERKMGTGDRLELSKLRWDESKNRCEGCLRKARDIQKLQKTFTKHLREGSCRGDAKMDCRACSEGDDLRDIEIPREVPGD